MFLDYLVKTCHSAIYRYQHVLDYLHSRLVTNEEIKSYELGFNKIISVPKEESDDYKEYVALHGNRKLENKIIFPIRDAIGNVIGVSGRSVETKEFKEFITLEAKYTGFFFGLSHALPHIYKDGKVYIVEGYFDRIALAKVLPNTVAALTAGITETQYNFLQLYCDKIITVFDSDKAGLLGTAKAPRFTEKIKEPWLPKDVASMSLGSYKDPAKCLETLGVNKFRDFILKKAKEVSIF